MINCYNSEYKESNKFKQTLIEIKEIAEKSMGKGQMISGGWLYQKKNQRMRGEK